MNVQAYYLFANFSLAFIFRPFKYNTRLIKINKNMLS